MSLVSQIRTKLVWILQKSWRHVLFRPLVILFSLMAVLTLKSCGGGDDGIAINPVHSPTTSFIQLERLAVPALNELFMNFASHDQSNRSTPRADQGFQESAIRSFFTAIGRSQEIADLVVFVTIPDEVEADLSQATGAYFGVELADAGVVPANFGGRRLTDDPIDVTLQVVFGEAVHGISDGAIPALTTDNVGPAAIRNTSTFPYMGSPI
jgi:hypothetical protein